MRRPAVTEAEWLASTEAQAMYVFLRDTTALFRTRWQGYRAVPRFAFSERKSRLFAVACCRRVLHLVPIEVTRAVVDVAERSADGLAGDDELRAAVQLSERAWHDRVLHGNRLWRYEREAVDAVHRLPRSEAAGRVGVMQAVALAQVWAAAVHQQLSGTEEPRALLRAEYTRQADLIRDIVNPFRPPVIAPSWLAWNDRCVERIARGIYEERAFDRLPILHDALLDAGCDNGDILAHCRKVEGHARGCWVIDLLLRKE
jgi:hypothetical protein